MLGQNGNRTFGVNPNKKIRVFINAEQSLAFILSVEIPPHVNEGLNAPLTIFGEESKVSCVGNLPHPAPFLSNNFIWLLHIGFYI